MSLNKPVFLKKCLGAPHSTVYARILATDSEVPVKVRKVITEVSKATLFLLVHGFL